MTNNHFKRLALLSIITLSAVGAYAVPMTFTHSYNPSQNILLNAYDAEYSFMHDLLGEGFNPLSDTVLSASLVLDVIDDGDYDYNRYNSYRYTTYCHWGHCHYGTRYYISSYGQPENLLLDIDGSTFGGYEIDYRTLALSLDPADLQDGLLNMGLSLTTGDLWFRQSTLTVDVDRAAVPEPGTLVLLSLGLVGVRLSRRRNS